MTLRQDIIARSREPLEAEAGLFYHNRVAAYRDGEKAANKFLAAGNNLVDAHSLFDRMKNSSYKNGFHTALRRNGAGY